MGGCGNKADAAGGDGVEGPGQAKVVGERRTGKSKGEEQAGAEDEEMSTRATSSLDTGNVCKKETQRFNLKSTAVITKCYL